MLNYPLYLLSYNHASVLLSHYTSYSVTKACAARNGKNVLQHDKNHSRLPLNVGGCSFWVCNVKCTHKSRKCLLSFALQKALYGLSSSFQVTMKIQHIVYFANYRAYWCQKPGSSSCRTEINIFTARYRKSVWSLI